MFLFQCFISSKDTISMKQHVSTSYLSPARAKKIDKIS